MVFVYRNLAGYGALKVHIGYLIKTWRILEKKTVREAAKDFDISPATLSRIENGKPMEQKTMVKLITLLFG